VEKPRFLFLEGSAGTVVAAAVATTALLDASAARGISSTYCPAAGASAPAPGACSSAASAALGEGAQGPTSQGACPTSLSSFSQFPDNEYSEVAGEKVPAARVAGTPRPVVPGAPAAGSSSPSCASPTLAPTAVPRAATRARGVGGSDRAASTVTLC
jgi:hypothetical protein